MLLADEFINKVDKRMLTSAENQIYIGTKTNEVFKMDIVSQTITPLYNGHSNHEVYNDKPPTIIINLVY